MEDDLKINALENALRRRELRHPAALGAGACRAPAGEGLRDARSPAARSRGPREPGGHWPKHAVEWADRLAQAELSEAERRAREAAQNFTILRPTSAEIAEMEAAFDWLRELRAVDSGMALVTSLWALRTARRKSRAPALHRKAMGAAHVLSQARQGARLSRRAF